MANARGPGPDTADRWTNRLLAALEPAGMAVLKPHLQTLHVEAGQVLFEPGDEVDVTYFPGRGTIVSLSVLNRDGSGTEAATIGREGAIGGVVSRGHKPAFGRAVVKAPGPILQLKTERLEWVKQQSPAVADLMTRYADCLLAELMQTAACNALHSLEQRYCRWLLAARDRAETDVLTVTQEALADTLGVQRTSVTETAGELQKKGYVRTGRGRIAILDRSGLERTACDCYRAVEEHRARLLPEATL